VEVVLGVLAGGKVFDCLRCLDLEAADVPVMFFEVEVHHQQGDSLVAVRERMVADYA
jgi:hypothetical protein